MGHGTMCAALIYQHATGERDREIADALQFRIERELKEMAHRGPNARNRQIIFGPGAKERGRLVGISLSSG